MYGIAWESCGTSNDESLGRSSTDYCAKFVSIWPEQYLQSMQRRFIICHYQLYVNVSDKVAFSMDVLLRCDCNHHDESSNALDIVQATPFYMNTNSMNWPPLPKKEMDRSCHSWNQCLVIRQATNKCRFMLPFY
eukprot:457767_1